MTSRPMLFSAPMVRALLDGRKTVTRRIINPQPPKMPAVDCHPNHKQKHLLPYLDAYCSNRPSPGNPRGMSEEWCWWQVDDRQCLPVFRCPYGRPGDELWVREAWRAPASLDKFSGKEIAEKALEAGYSTAWCPLKYDADGSLNSGADWRDWGSTADARPGRYRHARFMPKWASRITLKLMGVRVERLQDITAEDAIAEGIELFDPACPAFGWRDYGSAPKSQDAWQCPRESFRTLWESINGPQSWKANPYVWPLSIVRVVSAEMAVAA